MITIVPEKVLRIFTERLLHGGASKRDDIVSSENEAFRNHFYDKLLILTTFTDRDETPSYSACVR